MRMETPARSIGVGSLLRRQLGRRTRLDVNPVQIAVIADLLAGDEAISAIRHWEDPSHFRLLVEDLEDGPGLEIVQVRGQELQNSPPILGI